MTLWGLGNIILVVVIVPVLVALLSRVLGALERIRGAADDALAGGVALIGELDTTPDLLATTDSTIAGSTGAAATTDFATESSAARFEPYYTLFHDPSDPKKNPSFSMLRPFVPFSSDDARKELRSMMVVSSDPKSYGKIQVFELGDPLPEGPATVAAEFGSDPVKIGRAHV